MILLDDTNMIALYSVLMFLGYLSFMAPPEDWQERASKFFKLPASQVEPSEEQTDIDGQADVNEQADIEAQTDTAPQRHLQANLALLFAVAMFLVPARIYFWPDRPCSTLNFFDRSPMVFAMFLMRQKTKSMIVRYAAADGIWHELPLTGRMDSASSDNDLYALTNYLFASNEKIQRIQIANQVVINKHLLQIKNLDCSRGQTATLTLRSEELKIVP